MKRNMTLRVTCDKCGESQVIATGYVAETIIGDKLKDLLQSICWKVEPTTCPKCCGETKQSLALKVSLVLSHGKGRLGSLISEFFNNIESTVGKKFWKKSKTRAELATQFEQWARKTTEHE